jgi:hypothetical protein
MFSRVVKILMISTWATSFACSTTRNLNQAEQKELSTHGDVSASQILTLNLGENRTMTLLAELSIDHGKVQLVFLEPQMMSPVAKFEITGDESRVQLMGPLQELDEDDLKAMFGGIQTFYSEWFKAVRNGKQENFQHRDRVAQFQVRAVLPAGQCAAFPKLVNVSSKDDDTTFSVDVLTRDVSCSTPASNGGIR